MKNYLNSKLILLRKILDKKSTIITDKKIRPFNIIKKISQRRNLKLVNINKNLDLIKNISLEPMPDFKIKNLAMAIEAVKLCGLKEKTIFNSINNLENVDGRLELVKKYPNNIKVFIDYAHTPEALTKNLKIFTRKLWKKYFFSLRLWRKPRQNQKTTNGKSS